MKNFLAVSFGGVGGAVVDVPDGILSGVVIYLILYAVEHLKTAIARKRKEREDKDGD